MYRFHSGSHGWAKISDREVGGTLTLIIRAYEDKYEAEMGGDYLHLMPRVGHFVAAGGGCSMAGGKGIVVNVGRIVEKGL